MRLLFTAQSAMLLRLAVKLRLREKPDPQRAEDARSSESTLCVCPRAERARVVVRTQVIMPKSNWATIEGRGGKERKTRMKRTENAKTRLMQWLTGQRELRRNGMMLGVRMVDAQRHGRARDRNAEDASRRCGGISSTQSGERQRDELISRRDCPSTPSKSTKPIEWEGVVYREDTRDVQGFHAWNGGEKNGKGPRYAAPQRQIIRP
ncbi:hypothetical protein B0H13DRAFT_1890258 [Mycena leptocephala]|nr:hypothetical protein B0H13DRAFT_1890258 [Mycena leptocephala]